VGIGTSSPFADLAVIGATSHENPSFVVATTSNWNTNGSQAPMLYITATTTGSMDYARVAIGTTTTPYGGGAGLRDQLTVSGRIYQTWRYLSCDAPGAQMVAALSADALGACGDFGFDEDTTDTFTAVSGDIPFARIGTAATLTDAGSIRTGGFIGAASSSPVIEVVARHFSGMSTSSTVYIGFTGEAVGGNYVQNNAHVNAITFAASSTDNWIAIVRKNGAESRIDTGVASTTSSLPFQRFRIEVSSSTVIFLINGNVVAVHTSATTNNIPNANLYANVSAGTYTTGTPAARSFDISLMRVWTDDPPGGKVGGAGQLIGQQEFDPIQGADIAEAYLTDNPASFKEGMIVAEDLLGKVRLASEPYSRDILGSVSVSPHTTMGTETSSTTRVAMLGRVPVFVSLQNGPIKKGDRITSSGISGVGMRASRPGYILGNTLQEFDPDNGIGECVNNESYGLATTTCYGIVLVKLNPGFDMGIGNVVQDVGDAFTGAAEAAQELLNDAFTKGAELTKIVAGRVIAQFAVVKNMFASVFTILPGGNINVPSGQNQISGWSELQSGTTTVFVNNIGVNEGSKIFITPRALVDSQLVVTEILSGVGFKVETKVAPQSIVPFDWLIINTFGGTNAPNTKNTNPENIPIPENQNNILDNVESGNIPNPNNTEGSGLEESVSGNTESGNSAITDEPDVVEQTPTESNTPTTQDTTVPVEETTQTGGESNTPETSSPAENASAPLTEQTI
jgi:hypothetical protein